MIALYRREGIPLERLPVDVNPNEDHLAQATWNLFGLMHHEDLHPELDDLSTQPCKKEDGAFRTLTGASQQLP